MMAKLGSCFSQRRFKTDIKPMDNASEAILALKPVTFHYKPDDNDRHTAVWSRSPKKWPKVNPDLVVRDDKGKLYTVRYDAVNAMLLNEFLKEHRKNEQQESKLEEQEAKIARQEKQIEALTAGLQKVSAQLEASKPSSQVVSNQ